VDVGPLAVVAGLEADVADRLDRFDLTGATRAIAAAVTALNRDLEATRPWTLTGRTDASALDLLLARHVASARCIARAARPIVPALAARLLTQLPDDRRLPEPEPAFARIT
jgi:methionyl-tRNA synthetase